MDSQASLLLSTRKSAALHSRVPPSQTVSSHSGNRSSRTELMDQLSDDLIADILSLLDTKEAARTSVLGSRWRFLWAQSPNLDFEFLDWYQPNKRKEFVDGMNRLIGACKGKKLEKLTINFNDCSVPDVDHWIDFGCERNVQTVKLRIQNERHPYILPKIMYTSSSLVSLSLEFCNIQPPEGKIKWPSLIKLQISGVQISQLVMDNILLASPRLSSLQLHQCWGFTHLTINSTNLHDLVLRDPEDQIDLEPVLTISAPHIKYVDLLVYHMKREIHLQPCSSLVSVGYNFIGMDKVIPKAVFFDTETFFEEIHHIQELHLQDASIQVVSKLLDHGWQLPTGNIRCLRMDVAWDAKQTLLSSLDLPLCTLVILNASPTIDTLIISCDYPQMLEDNWTQLAKEKCNGDFINLKFIKLMNVVGDSSGDPIRTLAQILLERTPALQKMEIWFNVQDRDDFMKISQTVHAFPKSSTEALMLLH
ncbi:unnamed protein product [Cuscuta epithymum]|uniref:F-box/LRR-repeat protein 15/At3g58940/PEG3-like LRR domain-containing protein n=1 Tax=Cuscuta epithymum TaxID=186058 RepID=A0AAV0F9I3_9ASTE|nr:unnamed protein product [Cuscuta epithymum]